MSKVKQFKTTDNVVHDIYGQNVQGMDWDDYESLTPEQRNSDIAYFVPDAPSGLTLVEQTVSGLPANVASFSDAADAPLKTLKVSIVPVQSGSGDPSPSNPRPISGWTGANVNVSGINTWNEQWEVGGINTSGGDVPNTDRIRSKDYILCKANTTYYLKTSLTTNEIRISYYDKDKTFISQTGWLYNGVFTTPANAYYLRFNSSSVYGNTYLNDISINYPSTDTSYHAYVGTTVSISWQTEAGTVYGGELNVTSGVLTVNKAIVDLSTITTWNSGVVNAQTGMIRFLNAINGKEFGKADMLCNLFPTKATTGYDTDTSESISGIASSNTVYLVIDSNRLSGDLSTRESRAEALLNWLENNPTYVVYNLDEPTTVQLTPTQVKSLLGNNNIWVDCGQVNECTYYIYGQGTKPQLYFNDDVYAGSEVIANPEDAEATEKLNKLVVNGIVYDINPNVGERAIIDKLYEASTGAGAPLTTDITYLSGRLLSDYDLISVCLSDPTTFTQGTLTQVDAFNPASLIVDDAPINAPVGFTTANDGVCYVHFKDDCFRVVSQSGSTDEEPSVYSIYGIKVGGSTIEITPSIGSGTKVADYEIDGVAGAIYAPTAPTALSQLSDDSTHRTVTDTEKTAWSGKQDVLTFDNTPTSGSSNPVKSGGVYTALGAKANESEADELRRKVSAVENYAGTSYSILQTGTPGCILYADGSIYAISAVTSTYKYSDFIPVKKGAVIDYILRTPNNVAMIAFYTTASISSYVQSSSVVGTGGAVTGKYTVPADGYVILSMRNDLQTIKADYTYGGNIGELQDEIDTIENELDSYDGTKESIEILQHNTFSLNGEPTTNGFLNASGVLISNANYKTTGYIKVTKDDVFTYRIGHATTLPIICFYSGESESTADSTKFVMGINGYSEGTYTVSANGYVRYCYYKDKNDGYVVFNKNVADNVKITYPNNGASDLTILCLGDSIFGNDGEIATDLHLLSGATTINGAFGGTSVSVRSGTDQFQYFDGVNLANAICSQTWTNQDAAAEALKSSYPWVESRLADLKAVDMSKVDLITMDWGTNDYIQGKSISDIVSAYNIVIDALQEEYPSIRLLIITPIWRYFGNKTDDDNGDNHVYNVSTLKEIAQAIFDNAHDKRVETINMYQNMPLSYNTADLYFDSGSGVHLNATGNMVYAHILNGRIQTMY